MTEVINAFQRPIRTLLRQVDKELKRLLEQGADGLNQAAPDELSKNLLFYVAKSSAQSPHCKQRSWSMVKRRSMETPVLAPTPAMR